MINMTDKDQEKPVGEVTSSEEEQIFEDAPSADDILRGDVEEPAADEISEDGDSDGRSVPLFDETLKAPWEGAEEAWRKHSAGGDRTPCEEGGTRSDCDEASDGIDGDDGRISMPTGLPATKMSPVRADLTPGHKLAIALCALAMLGAAAALLWAFDLRDESDHRQRHITSLQKRMDGRMRQIAALRDSGEARVKELEERIASLSGAKDATTRRWVSQLQDNLDQARRDVVLADEQIAGDELDEQIREADSSKKRREDSLALKVAGVDHLAQDLDNATEAPSQEVPQPAEEEPEGDTDALDDLLEGAIGDRALLPSEKKAPAKASENKLPEESASNLPQQPGRDQVKSAMGLVAGRVKACAKGDTGRLLVRMKVLGATGRIADAVVIDDKFKGTSVASCAARAVKQAKFPRFARQNISIKYPFDL